MAWSHELKAARWVFPRAVFRSCYETAAVYLGQRREEFRSHRNHQRYHEAYGQPNHRASSYSAIKHLLFAGSHFALQRLRAPYHNPKNMDAWLGPAHAAD